MNESPPPNTGTMDGNASTGSSIESHDGISTLRMELAVLAGYSNCSNCRRVLALWNSMNVDKDTLLIAMREHRASHFAIHYYEDGTND